MKRKSISNKIRFEVFKRDSFTCQYCGRKAPDVLLQVDHIKPVAKGGSNGILNLITSCAGCNNGKSDKELSDQSVVEKQRRQLEELEERRQQLEMMMQWHTGLQQHDQMEIKKFIEYFNTVNKSRISLTASGEAAAKKLFKKFGFHKVIEAVDLVATKYPNLEAGERFDKLGPVLNYEHSSEEEKKAMYIRGVCRNRFYFSYQYGTQLIKKAVQMYEYDFLLEIAKTSRNWSQWKAQMEDLLADPEEDDDDPLPF